MLRQLKQAAQKQCLKIDYFKIKAINNPIINKPITYEEICTSKGLENTAILNMK